MRDRGFFPRIRRKRSTSISYRAADKPRSFKFADRLARFTRKPERRIVRFMDLFSCPKCGAKYRVKRLYWQSSKAPVCESCGADFPKPKVGLGCSMSAPTLSTSQGKGEMAATRPKRPRDYSQVAKLRALGRKILRRPIFAEN